MHSRFPAGWRFTLRTALTATLILLPFAAAIAEAPQSISDNGAGLRAVEGQQDGIPSRVEYARANYVWPFAVGPFYGEVDRASYRAPGVVHTGVGSFDLTLGDLNIPGPLKTPVKLSSQPAQYFIISLDPKAGAARPELEELITSSGGAVSLSLPVASWVARLTPEGMSAIQARSEVLAVVPYHAALKLDPMIGRVALNDPARALSEVYRLEVRIFEGENAELVAQQLARMGGNVTSISPKTIRVEINRSKLADLAALEPVQQINEDIPVRPHAEESATTVQTGRWNAGATPYNDVGIDGSGGGVAGANVQVLMVLDSGIQLDAGDLSDTDTTAGTAGPSHRKVLRYESTASYGGQGDLVGCDASLQGGYTHGNLVSATALGNATNVAPAYGTGWLATDEIGNSWGLDGVAPGAKLVAFDSQITPPSVSCSDPLLGTFDVGNLYIAPTGGSLGESYTDNGARIFNFSWGANLNSYTTNALDVDEFLFDKKDAMVFISAGNEGDDADSDSFPDLGTLGTPATTKNGLAIGASGVGNDLGEGGQPRDRAFFSSMGPAADTNVVSGRVAPQLMAPGNENGGGDMGMASEFGCRSNDNDQDSPVECDTISAIEGTSFAAPGAAGAAVLVRDYFAQGFYPDGTSSNPGNSGDQVANISGALVKSILIASADFLDRQNVTYEFRFNNEQGYGRINMANALPLQNWPASASGLAVADGGIPSGVNNLSGLSGTIAANAATSQTANFEVCDDTRELRVALSWIEEEGVSALVSDLDLIVQSPSGKLYWGNYFTDDNNRNRVLDSGEDCPGVDGTVGFIDNAAWSLPTTGCGNAVRDAYNPTEAIMLSPDYKGDGDTDLNPDDDNQLEVGTWTVTVESQGTGTDPAQRYAVAIAGGVCLGSSVRFDEGVYSCNSIATITINEKSETGDAAPDTATIESRTTVDVLDSLGAVMDTETGAALGFTQPDVSALNFESDNVILTDGTAYDPGNGVLDVRTGNTIRVTYQDVDAGGTPDPNKVRISYSTVNCNARITFGDIVFGQFGQDSGYFVDGGCERNARDNFEFGYPDRYMDAEESVAYLFAFSSGEEGDLTNAEVNLRCVIADGPGGDSPEDCKPNTNDCADPNRENNVTCDGSVGTDPVYMTILDTPKLVGLIPSGAGLSANFSIQMASTIPGTPEIEIILEVVARAAGKTTKGIALNRHTLDVDENSIFYSTDYPTGGTEFKDLNNNEVMEDPITELGNDLRDYEFETRTWSDLTAGGTKNTQLSSPWNFDGNKGGFTSGLGANTTESSIIDTIAQWGEDKNFNDVLDGFCNVDISVGCETKNDCIFASAGTVCNTLEDRDYINLTLDHAWGSLGGCGWQTKAGGDTEGYIWHTGMIKGTTSGSCLFLANNAGQCQTFETISGSSGQLYWFEILTTPEIAKVNGDDYTIEITDWGWNQAVDLPDSNVSWTWEFDTDTTKLEPVDLKADDTVLNGGNGGYGSVSNLSNPDLTNGFSVFSAVQGACRVNTGTPCSLSSDCTKLCGGTGAPCDVDEDCLGGATCDNCGNAADTTGTLGGNREGQNSCFFRGPDGIAPGAFDVLGLAGPEDDDLDNDSDGTIDEYVTTNGPVRNMDIYAFNGWDMRFNTLEDIYGDTGDFFQAGVGMQNFEKAEETLPDPAGGYGVGVDDMVIEWREFNLVDDATTCLSNGECAVISAATSDLYQGSTLITYTVVDKSPPTDNDCDFDDVPDGTTDCDSNGTQDVVVKATSQAEIAGEIAVLNLVLGTTDTFRADLPISNLYDVAGVLLIQPIPPDPAEVTAFYQDLDDGTGQVCKNSADPASQGRLEVLTQIALSLGRPTLVTAILTDNGDNDGWADSNETVQMQIKLSNNTDNDYSAVAARLATNDPKIECITNTFIDFGDLPARSSSVSTGFFEFKVADVDRPGTALEPFTVEFTVILSANEFDSTVDEQPLFLDLDLDASGGSGPGQYFEGFETASFGTFTTMNLDAGRNNFPGSDGYRCSYHDPDWIYSNSYTTIADCYLAASAAQANDYFWSVRDGNAPIDPVGRSKSGQYSLSMTYWDATDSLYTSPLAILEAIRLNNPINLGWDGVAPELSFWHQAAFMDGRIVNTRDGTSADGGAVAVQLADGAGNAVGDWIKIQPYFNFHDQPRTDQYNNCMFDPVDDGNTEDDFFDPSDPERVLGPSTLCFPEKVFVDLGDTGSAFSEGNIGNADGPGALGATGLGTWVETKFDLTRFRGRSIRFRFVHGSIKAGAFETVNAIFPDVIDKSADDGWWIDDITLTDTLGTAATVVVDTKDNSALPGCGSNCTTATAALVADPPGALPAPGQVVELSAASSSADACQQGTLQYQYYVDGQLVRSWTDNPVLITAPLGTTTYGVDVRCSTQKSCIDSTTLVVPVDCPSSGNLGANMIITAPSSKTAYDFDASYTYHYCEGADTNLPSYTCNVINYPATAGPATSHTMVLGTPPAGSFFWTLFRTSGTLGAGAFCNSPGNSWGSTARDAVLP